jgi:tetratricopeptide (TPR) repeat protein
VFVFRQSRKAPQTRSTGKAKNAPKRDVAQRQVTRKKVHEQVAAIQKAKPRPRATKVENPPPTTTAKVPKTQSRTDASKVFAGAGETFLDQNDLDKAIEFFKKSVELDPKNAPGKLGLSEAYARKGDDVLDKTGTPETALFFYEEAVKANPNNAAGHSGLAEVFDSMGSSDKALASYEKALALDPALTQLYSPMGILYYQKGDMAKAEPLLAKALAIDPNDGEAQYFNGLILAKQNRNDEAINAFKITLAKNANSAEAHLALGEAYDRTDRDREAMIEYKEALRINPRYPEAYFDLGVANYNREKYTDAAANYQEAIRLKNDYADAHVNLAETYRQLAMDERDANRKKDLFNKAVGSYRLATAFVKNDTEMYSSYGYVLGRLGRWNDAIDTLKMAMTPESDAIDYSNIGWAYYNASQEDSAYQRADQAKLKLQEARTALERSVSLDRNFEAAYLNLGITQNDQGDFTAAVASLQNAVRLKKNWTFALNELGIAYRKLNQLDNAVEQFKRVTEIDNNFTSGFYNLAESEFRRGHTKDAKKAQDRVRKLNPNLARQLDVIFSGAVLTDAQRKVENKVNDANPVNKLPKIPKFKLP